MAITEPNGSRNFSSSHLARAQPMRDCQNSAKEKSLHFKLLIPPILHASQLPFLLCKSSLFVTRDLHIVVVADPKLQLSVDLK